MSRALAGLATLLGLAACEPFGPNLTGRWSGQCPTRPKFELLLEVADRSGDIEGEGLITMPLREGEVLARTFELELEGGRVEDDAVMDVIVGPLGVTTLDGTLDGDQLRAELGDRYWPLGRCELDLER